MKKIRANTGAAMMKTLFMLMILMILMSFLYQLFVIYTTAASVRTAVQDAVISVAAANKPKLYYSLREGNTVVGGKNLDEAEYALLTDEELTEKLAQMLGLSIRENSLEKLGSAGVLYSINDITVSAVNTTSRNSDQTTTFVTQLELVIPLASYWEFTSLEIPMTVKAGYTAKF